MAPFSGGLYQQRLRLGYGSRRGNNVTPEMDWRSS
jgi:hypothetical protein